MSNTVVLAASYLGPDGHGNDLTGLWSWPASHAEAFQRGELTGVHWSLLFPSDASRFARMDLMCRLGYLATELLGAGLEEMPPERRERLGVCVETCAGSLATDVRFLQTPRPSLFAYTLPSTVLGEICIRYRLRGPVLCLVSPQSPRREGLMEALHWLEEGAAGDCLCVVCEAVDRHLAGALALPPAMDPGAWHAAALLLGRGTGQAREHPLEPGTLVEICRHLCGRLRG